VGEEEHVFVAFLDAKGTLGVAALAGERRVFHHHLELNLVPAAFAAADGIAPDNGRVVEAVVHGVHGGPADDVLVGLEDVERALLQELLLRGFEALADAALHGQAVGRDDFADEFWRGVGKQEVVEGGDGKSARAARRVAHRPADLRVHHFDHDADEMGRGAEWRGALLSAEVVDKDFDGVLHWNCAHWQSLSLISQQRVRKMPFDFANRF
jgi:hypothetical protein